MMRMMDYIYKYEDDGILQSRMDFTRDDLMKSHPELSDRDAADLYCALQNRKEFKGIDFDHIPAEIIKEYMKETLHNSYDGWRDDTHDTIEAMMYDIMRYAKHRR